VVAMTTVTHIKASITPWDDPAFMKAFEQAKDQVVSDAEHPDWPRAALEVQHRLREAGYPDARVEVVRTVEEALRHTSHWIVSRDG
jgi:hypothetical protein